MRPLTVLSLSLLFVGCNRSDKETAEKPAQVTRKPFVPGSDQHPDSEEQLRSREDASPIATVHAENLTAQDQADRKELVRGNNEFAWA